MQSAICLVVDRLHAGYLGCYGNTWIATPAFNRLAAEAFVFDQALIDSSSLEQLYRGYWWGTQAVEPPSTAPQDSLMRRLAAAGVHTALITDEPQLALGPLAGEVQELLHVATPENIGNAQTLDETRLAALFAAVIEWLAAAQQPFCLWVHLGSLGTAWDAPLELRNHYADPDEPLPPELVAPPRLVLDEDYDPDELLGYSQAYAGQVSALDECLGGLLDWIAEQPWSASTLLTMLGARGLALGEHRRVGCWDEALGGELLHVPWFVRMPDGTGRAARSQALIEPDDLAMTLSEWWQLPQPALGGPLARSLLPLVRDEVTAVRDRICIAGASGQRAIRTPGWFLRWAGSVPVPGDDPAASHWLYAKPDDRFEMNDVADRCPDIVEALERGWNELVEAARTGSSSPLTALPAELLADQV
jgi:arylsulfatase A-like enzyme